MTVDLLLRILYTVNGSQYILAKPPLPVPVEPIAEHNSRTTSSEPAPPRYGTVCLKTCLDTICESSPELIQEGTKDFSVYVLDPLESNSAPPVVQISQHESTNPVHTTSNQSRAVAVGFGLMSSALAADPKTNVQVAGTLMKTGTGQEALEVIFALRETFSAPRATQPTTSRVTPSEPPLKRHRTHPAGPRNASSSSSSSAPLSAQTSALNGRRASTKPTRPPKTAPFPLTESERLLQSTETYFGPLKKKGRPRIEKPGSSVPPGEEIKGRVQLENGLKTMMPTPSDSLPAAQPGLLSSSSDSNKPRLMNILALLSGTSSSSAIGQYAANAALLTALSSIDSSKSSDNQDTGTDLATALTQLLETWSRQTSTGQPTTQSVVKVESHDDEIVLLDKENINPIAFKKKNHRDADRKPVSATSLPQGRNRAGVTPYTERSIFGTSSRANELGSAKSDAVSRITSSMNTTSTLRKRRLDEFMEEREAKANASPSWRVVNTPEPSITNIALTSLRHYPRILASAAYSQTEKPLTNYYRTPLEPWSSPARHTKELQNENSNSSENPIIIPDSPKKPKAVTSSPHRSSVQKILRKKYIVPEWARTDTSTKPRFSEEAQKAIEDAQTKKRQEKVASRKKNNAAAQARLKERQQERRINQSTTEHNPVSTSKENASAPQPIRAAPIAANASFSGVFTFGSQLFTQSNSPRRTPSPNPFHVPRTPPRNRAAYPRTPSKSREGVSLFTPTPKSWGATKSPLFSPFGVIVSPTTGKGKGKTMESPTKSPSLSTNLSRHGACGQSLADQVPGSRDDGRNNDEKKSDDDDDDDDDDDFLGRELDSDVDEFEAPPSSLPVLTSDAAPELHLADPSPAENSHSENDGDDEAEDADRTICLANKQHWLNELPPSSPPPPTSPLLESGDFLSEPDFSGRTDDEYELPTASDNDDPSPATSPDNPKSPPDPDPTTDALKIQGFEQIFANTDPLTGEPRKSIPDHTAPLSQPFTDTTTSAFGIDILDQFTNHSMLSSDDALQDLSGIDMSFGLEHNGLAVDFDFSEFWNTFKGLAQEHQAGLGLSTPHGECVDAHRTSIAETNNRPDKAITGPLPNLTDSENQSSDINNTIITNVPGFGDIDAAKLAESVQSLLSGCLM